MTQAELVEIVQAIEAEPVSLARTVALAMLAEVERLTARVKELKRDLAEARKELGRFPTGPEGMMND